MWPRIFFPRKRKYFSWCSPQLVLSFYLVNSYSAIIIFSRNVVCFHVPLYVRPYPATWLPRKCIPPRVSRRYERKVTGLLLVKRIKKQAKKLNLVGNKAKGRISKRVFQESKARQNFRKTNISYPLIRTRACGVSFGVICFLETPVLRFAFCLNTDDLRC